MTGTEGVALFRSPDLPISLGTGLTPFLFHSQRSKQHSPCPHPSCPIQLPR